MRRHPARPTFTLTLAAGASLLLLSAWTATPATAGRDCGPWCPEMTSSDGAVRLTPVTAAYEVDVFGTVAMGTLIQEFRNDSDSDVTARYKYLKPSGLKISTLNLEVDGNVTAVDMAVPAAAGRRASSQGRSGKRAQPKAGSVKPKAVTVDVERGEVVTVRTGFQARLPLSSGLFRLSLPAVKTIDVGVVGLEVRVRHEEPLAHAASKTHEIYADYEGDYTRIQPADGMGGREFQLEFAVGPDDDPSLVGYVGRERDGTREVLAVLTPPSKPRTGSARPKQMLFVLDTSGSMAKGKLDQARTALFATLQKLNDDDMYNIVEFDAAFSMFREQPVGVSDVAVETAGQWLQLQRSGGGTRLLPALQAAFEQEQNVDRHNMIVILTDGNVQDSVEVERLLQSKLGQARLFVLGIGEDVNQERISRFAESGRGTAALSREASSLESVLAALFESISEPLAWDLEIDWGGADVELIKPTKLPDLYAGSPVTILGRVRGRAPEQIVIQGTTMDGQRSFSAQLPDTEVEQLEHLVPATKTRQTKR